MEQLEKARKALAQVVRNGVQQVRTGLQQALATDPPAPLHSGRVRQQSWEPSAYAMHVDDAKLYRDASRRSVDDVPTEHVLVRADGNPVQLRNRGGSQDRYLTVVADVPEWAQKQGLSGTVTAGGLPQVENKQNLKPLLARGLTYDQGEFERMARSNPVARNAIRATVERVAQASEYYAAPDVDWEALAYAPGLSPDAVHLQATRMREACERAAEVLNLEWYHNPDVDPLQVTREQAYAMVPGFVLHEFGLDPRLQGRRKTTFVEHRAQSSVLRWLWDQQERWCGIVQNASGSPGLLADIPVAGVTVQGMPVIDRRKLLLVTNQRVGLNLEGLSDLRAAWYASQGKSEWFISALMHRRKWGNGFPLFRADGDSAKSKQVSDSIAKAAQDFFYNGQAYVSLPAGVTMEMLEFDSDTGFIVAMEYFDKEILRSLGALATEIGQSGGSYNLMDVQQAERLRQLQGYATQVRTSRKPWIQAACSMLVGELPVLPELRIEGIMTRSDSEVLQVWQGVAAVRNATKPDGTPVYSDADMRNLCDTVGVPYTSAEDAVQDAALQDVDQQVEALDPATLAVVQEILGKLVASDANPVPLAPQVAVQLLVAAGVPSDKAQEMVDAQAGATVATQGMDQALASGAVAPSTGQGLAEATGAPATLARRQAARTLDDVDTKPSLAMAKTAARALQWRAEYGRGGTEVGVARARDIANRRNLSESTVRRMRAYFDRHASDSDATGWNLGETKFPSAGRVAWDLWGGDAGRSWAARKVAEFDRIRKASRHAALQVLAAKSDNVPVVGRDQRVFFTHRALAGAEATVAWATLYAGIQTETQALTVVALDVAKRQRSKFVDLASAAIASGSVDTIAGLQVSMVDEYAAAFGVLLQGWSDVAQKEMLAEIKAQVGKNWVPAVEDSTFAATLDNVVRAQSLALAQQVDELWQRQLRQAALTEATGLQRVQPLRAMEVPVATFEKASTQAVTQVQNLTREEVARTAGPAIVQATYSAIMDRNTCKNCKAKDGTVYQFGSTQYVRDRPPLFDCLSRLGPYGNVCRCVYVYAFDTTVGTAGTSQQVQLGAQ